MAAVVPLSPTQHWILDRQFRNPGNYNMIYALEVSPGIDLATIPRALRWVVFRNDALRMRFVRDQKSWVQLCEDTPEEMEVVHADFSTLSVIDGQTALELLSYQLRQGLDITREPLIRMGIIRRPAPLTPCVVLVFSHLVFDGFSRPIFLREFAAGVSSASQCEEPTTSAVSFADWTRRLSQYANSPQAEEEFAYWRGLPWERLGDAPGDVSHGASNTYASSEELHVDCGIEQSRYVQARGALGFALVLDAFFLAYCHLFQRDALLIDMTGHGRDVVFPGLNVRRTIGCFTVNTPLLLSLGRDRERYSDLRATALQMARVPLHGVGYGALRSLSQDPAKREYLASRPQSEIKFNFRGPRPKAEQTQFRPFPLSVPGAMDSDDLREYRLNVEVYPAADIMRITFKFSNSLHDRATISALAKRCLKNIASPTSG